MRRRLIARLAITLVLAAGAFAVADRTRPEPQQARIDPVSKAVDGERLAAVARGARVARAARSVPAAMLRNYGVLRRPRDKSDSGVPSSFLSRRGSDPRFVRLARVHRGASLFVVPGSREICVINPVDAGACHLTSWALRGYMLGTSELTDHGPEGGVRVYGLIRDGVRTITLVMADGRSVRGDVRNNVFVVDVRGVPAELEWEERGKLVRRPVPYAE